MIISDERMEKIMKNLAKVESSFHYQDNKIHEELVASTKNKKKTGYILLILAGGLYLFGPEKIFGITHINILYLIIIFIAFRTAQIWLDYILGKLEIIEDFIKNREIQEVVQDKFLVDLYSLDDVESEEGNHMVVKYALEKIKHKNK